MKIYKQMENEITDYLTGWVEISEGYRFSQYRLIKRIMLYANQVLPRGKVDSQGNYKYWIDIMQPRIDSEVKNLDFDTRDVSVYSESKADAGPLILVNLALKNWMRDNDQATQFNESVEEGSGWGNVLWKKVKGGYDRLNLKDVYIINQQAKTVNDTPIIERHILTQSDLRAKRGIWKNIDEVISECGNMYFSVPAESGVRETKETPYYEVYERNGEISEQDLFEAQGKEGGDRDKYILSKIVVIGLKKGGSTEHQYVLYADALPGIMSDVYKEYHRGRYTGRWFRVGIYELLFDIQTRANEISNQIARGLDWASRVIFRTQDNLIAQNIMTDMRNGDVIRSTDLQQVDVRMRSLDQLIADWNRLMEAADRLCNSYEVVAGDSLPTNTPFKLGNLINNNANKLFDYLREKLALSFESVFQDWILPQLMDDLKIKEVLRLTGEPEMIDRYYDMVVNAWYVKNLLAMPPHGPDVTVLMLEAKKEELLKNPSQLVELQENWLSGVKARGSIVISGEGSSLDSDLQSLSTFIQLEQDPIRRTALIEKAMMRKGMDVASLPKTPPPQPGQEPTQTGSAPRPTNMDLPTS